MFEVNCCSPEDLVSGFSKLSDKGIAFNSNLSENFPPDESSLAKDWTQFKN